MTEREVVHTELSEHVLTITMDRPEARNAINQQMMVELGAAYSRFNEDDECRVAVLQAEGPTFCAGADLKEALGDRSDGSGSSRVEAAPDLAEKSAMAQRRKPLRRL